MITKDFFNNISGVAKKTVWYVVGFIVGGSVVTGLTVFAAWSDPPLPPIGGNPDAPLNVGGSPQVKDGSLDINSNLTTHGYLTVSRSTAGSFTYAQLAANGAGGGGGVSGLGYTWRLFTSADDLNTGANPGVKPNAFEIWEYPNTGGSYARFQIEDRAAATTPYPVEIDAAGGLTLKGGKISVFDPASGSNGQLEYINTAGNIGLHITSGNVRALFLNWARGTGGVRVGNGASAPGTLYARDIILKAYDGANCYKVEVNNTGVLRTVLATC